MASYNSQLSINIEFSLKGYWFLPENPSRKVAGVLTYLPSSELTLELIGGFEEDNDLSNLIENSQSKNKISAIRGITSDGKEITLLNCYYSMSINFACPFPMEKYSCGLMISGNYLNSIEEKWISEAFIEIPNIEYFISGSPFTRTAGEGGSIAIKTNPLVFNEIENSVKYEGYTFSLKNSSKYEIGRNRAEIKSAPILYITSEKTFSFLDLNRVIRLFTDFFSFASLTPAYIINIDVHSPDLYEEFEGRKIYDRINIIYLQEEFKKKLSVMDILLRYDKIKGIYPSIIKKWFDEDELMSPIKSHLIEVITRQHNYSSMTYLLTIQAIEGYYYRYIDKDERSLEALLKRLIESFNSVDTIRDIQWNYKALTHSRHYYSHFIPKSKKPETLFGGGACRCNFKTQNSFNLLCIEASGI